MSHRAEREGLLPDGYGTIVADPPWRYTNASPRIRTGYNPASAEGHYPTMGLDEIAALPVRDLAAKSAHLYLWTTNPKMFGDRGRRKEQPAPIDILEGWGFRYVTTLTWIKVSSQGAPHRGGMGFYFRGCTEHCLFGIRGDAASIPVEIREPNVILAQRRRHSEKPDEIFQIAERVSPGPRLELFARRKRAGWDAWGNEVESDVEIAA